MRLGGINHLRVETFEGERVSESPMIVGFNEQGGAYAGKGGSTTIDEFEVESSRNRQPGSPTVDAVIKLEVGQISNILSRYNLRSNKAWAGKINQGLSRGVRQASNKPLLIDSIMPDLGVIGIHTYYLARDLVDQGVFETSELGYFLGTPAAVNLTFKAINKVTGGNRRWSMFYGPQLDRAALLQVRTRLQKVVKSAE